MGLVKKDMCKTTMSPQKQRRQRLGLDGTTPGSLFMHEICAHTYFHYQLLLSFHFTIFLVTS